jgi:phosphoglycerate dehydrogenase-like enzyme
LQRVRRQAQTDVPDGISFIGGPERLDDFLRQADYLAITLSLSPATRNLIDDRRLRLMKPTAFLINVARAEICNEAALYRALASGRIAGAALDVWYDYPTSAEPTPPPDTNPSPQPWSASRPRLPRAREKC